MNLYQVRILSDMEGSEKKMVEDIILGEPQGLSNEMLIKRLPGVSATSRAQAINQLLKDMKEFFPMSFVYSCCDGFADI